MHHFGLISPPGPSHVTGLTTIARESCRRGHSATFFNIPDVEHVALREGVQFHALGAKDHPKGSFEEFSNTFGRMHGMEAMRFGLRTALREIVMLLEEAPQAMRSAGVTALLIDQGQPAGSTIAERLRVPFITVCNAVHADPDPDVPPALIGWGPATSWAGRIRIRVACALFEAAVTPLRWKVNVYRRAWGLEPLRSRYDSFSPLLELAQQTAAFDFPRRSLPPQFHYVGLIRRASSNVSFPFERLDGWPLVYGSLGTVAVDAEGIFPMLAEACAPLNVQLVLTLGGRGDPTRYADLPGAPVVVTYAPQFGLLERARVTVCHGGHNTVLESLACGVPVVAVPHNADQYGVAARLTHSGAGISIPLSKLNSARLGDAIGRLLTDRSYKDRADVIRASIESAGGEMRAADLKSTTSPAEVERGRGVLEVQPDPEDRTMDRSALQQQVAVRKGRSTPSPPNAAQIASASMRQVPLDAAAPQKNAPSNRLSHNVPCRNPITLERRDVNVDADAERHPRKDRVHGNLPTFLGGLSASTRRRGDVNNQNAEDRQSEGKLAHRASVSRHLGAPELALRRYCTEVSRPGLTAGNFRWHGTGHAEGFR